MDLVRDVSHLVMLSAAVAGAGYGFTRLARQMRSPESAVEFSPPIVVVSAVSCARVPGVLWQLHPPYQPAPSFSPGCLAPAETGGVDTDIVFVTAFDTTAIASWHRVLQWLPSALNFRFRLLSLNYSETLASPSELSSRAEYLWNVLRLAGVR
jgi:hypothetical protein